MLTKYARAWRVHVVCVLYERKLRLSIFHLRRHAAMQKLFRATRRGILRAAFTGGVQPSAGAPASTAAAAAATTASRAWLGDQSRGSGVPPPERPAPHPPWQSQRRRQ